MQQDARSVERYAVPEWLRESMLLDADSPAAFIVTQSGAVIPGNQLHQRLVPSRRPVVRLQFQSPLEVRGSSVKVAQKVSHHAQVIARLGVIRLQVQRPFITGDCQL